MDPHCPDEYKRLRRVLKHVSQTYLREGAPKRLSALRCLHTGHASQVTDTPAQCHIYAVLDRTDQGWEAQRDLLQRLYGRDLVIETCGAGEWILVDQ